MFIYSLGDVTVIICVDEFKGIEIVLDMDYYKRLPFIAGEEVTIVKHGKTDKCTITSTKSGLSGEATIRNTNYNDIPIV